MGFFGSVSNSYIDIIPNPDEYSPDLNFWRMLSNDSIK
jgi:hypothetical protein